MNQIDSDLEEGEILDDSPPSPKFNNKKKELPRRYTVGDNKKSMHKHKKGCRHAIRYHAKKLSKLKKTPTRIKYSPKQCQKSSCKREKSHKSPGRYNSSDTSKHILPIRGHFSENSLIAEMKSSFKNVPPSYKLNANVDEPNEEGISFLARAFNPSEKEIFASKMTMLKNIFENSETNARCRNFEHLSEKNYSNLSKISNVSVIELSSDSNPHSNDSVKRPNDTSSIIDLNSDNNAKNVGNYVSTNSFQVKNEDSEDEDEEELRRIALATCAKRKALTECENTLENIDYPCSVPVPDLPVVNNVQIFHQKTNLSSDNYEVVDMEVDEVMEDEVQESLKIVQPSSINPETEYTKDCFFIDTNPSNDFQQNKENSFSEPQTICNSSDEDFETDILRSELINNMYRKQLLQDNLEQESNITLPEKQIAQPVVQQKKPLVNYQSPNLMFRNKRLKSAKHFLRKRSVNKLETLKNNKIAVPVRAKQPERLIITVNGESSDDSDNSDEEANNGSENPVDSIVALISDCRQKSQSSIETEEKEIVPKAVSCLSKAQQEEYNSLMKILAKKEKLPTAQKTLNTKNGSVYSPSEDLKKLDEKLALFQGALKNKKEALALIVKEVKSKNHECKKANLTVQFLKEKLVAAEKVRKAKLLELSKSHVSLKLARQSASDVMKKINEVRSLRSKLEGQSYKLSLLSDNKQS